VYAHAAGDPHGEAVDSAAALGDEAEMFTVAAAQSSPQPENAILYLRGN